MLARAIHGCTLRAALSATTTTPACDWPAKAIDKEASFRRRSLPTYRSMFRSAFGDDRRGRLALAYEASTQAQACHHQRHCENQLFHCPTPSVPFTANPNWDTQYLPAGVGPSSAKKPQSTWIRRKCGDALAIQKFRLFKCLGINSNPLMVPRRTIFRRRLPLQNLLWGARIRQPKTPGCGCRSMESG